MAEPGDAAAAPIWARPAVAPKALSREGIVAAAIDLADADGLSAVSMRRVAAVLDARVMSLYRHVPAKDDLLDLMFDELARQCVVRTRRGEAWATTVSRMAHRWREVAMAHPWSMTILSQRAQVGPQTLRLLDSWMGSLETMPASMTERWAAVTAVNDYVVGYVMRECAQRAAVPGDPKAAKAWRKVMSDYLNQLADSGDYDNLAPLMREGYAKVPDNFDRGLQLLLDGLTHRHP